MQFFFNLFSKVGLFLFFILLEVVSLYFISTGSDFHKNAIGKKVMTVNGYFSEKISFVKNYINLPEQNSTLLKENTALRNKLELYKKNHISSGVDSLAKPGYKFVSANIIDYSLRKKDNYFYINKGSKNGIKKNMAVISTGGIVGTVLNVSDNYSSIISVLHSKTKIKAKIKNLSYFGIIEWEGKDHRELRLKEIPRYLTAAKGDTIVTAGASAIYPPQIPIGVIEQIDPNEQTGDYDIIVKMFDDLASINNVYVIENINSDEIQEIKIEDNVIGQ